jgi:hypothetical protein
MLLRKTEKGRDELKPGVRELGLRERGLLLLLDGKKTLADVQGMFNGEAEKVASSLVQRGYLEKVESTALGGDPDNTELVALPVGNSRLPDLRQLAPAPAPAPAYATANALTPAQSPAASVDTFVGKRSLATTRMFLFDICERMFARRDKHLAEKFREALRDAKDRESMLDVSREMIAEIERVAGPERADSIRERIAMLLPAEGQVS